MPTWKSLRKTIWKKAQRSFLTYFDIFGVDVLSILNQFQVFLAQNVHKWKQTLQNISRQDLNHLILMNLKSY